MKNFSGVMFNATMPRTETAAFLNGRIQDTQALAVM